MVNQMIENKMLAKKVGVTVTDKFLSEHLGSEEKDSLRIWMNIYFRMFVTGKSEKTIKAKRSDFEKFLNFYLDAMQSDNIDLWTPSVTEQFQKEMRKSTYEIKKKKGSITKTYSISTINRVMAVIRHLILPQKYVLKMVQNQE
jgi:hypothetical protein